MGNVFTPEMLKALGKTATDLDQAQQPQQQPQGKTGVFTPDMLKALGKTQQDVAGLPQTEESRLRQEYENKSPGQQVLSDIGDFFTGVGTGAAAGLPRTYGDPATQKFIDTAGRRSPYLAQGGELLGSAFGGPGRATGLLIKGGERLIPKALPFIADLTAKTGISGGANALVAGAQTLMNGGSIQDAIDAAKTGAIIGSSVRGGGGLAARGVSTIEPAASGVRAKYYRRGYEAGKSAYPEVQQAFKAGQREETPVAAMNRYGALEKGKWDFDARPVLAVPIFDKMKELNRNIMNPNGTLKIDPHSTEMMQFRNVQGIIRDMMGRNNGGAVMKVNDLHAYQRQLQNYARGKGNVANYSRQLAREIQNQITRQVDPNYGPEVRRYAQAMRAQEAGAHLGGEKTPSHKIGGLFTGVSTGTALGVASHLAAIDPILATFIGVPAAVMAGVARSPKASGSVAFRAGQIAKALEPAGGLPSIATQFQLQEDRKKRNAGQQ